MNIFEEALYQISKAVNERHGLVDTVKTFTDDIYAQLKDKLAQPYESHYNLLDPPAELKNNLKDAGELIEYFQWHYHNCTGDAYKNSAYIPFEYILTYNDTVENYHIPIIIVWFVEPKKGWKCRRFGGFANVYNYYNDILEMVVIYEEKNEEKDKDTLEHELRHAYDIVKEKDKAEQTVKASNNYDTLDNSCLQLCKDIDKANEIYLFFYHFTETEMNAYQHGLKKHIKDRFKQTGLKGFIKEEFGGSIQKYLQSKWSPVRDYTPIVLIDEVLKNEESLFTFIFKDRDVDRFIDLTPEVSTYILTKLFARVGWDYKKYAEKVSASKLSPEEAYKKFIGNKLYLKLRKIYDHYINNLYKITYDTLEEIIAAEKEKKKKK